MKHCYSFFRRVSTFPSVLRILFILFFAITANTISAANVVKYDFNSDAELDRWMFVKSNEANVSYSLMTTGGQGWTSTGSDDKFFDFTLKNKGDESLTMTTNDSYSNISNITFDAVSGDNGKPSFTLRIVMEDGTFETLLDKVGVKSGLGATGNKKWKRGYSYDLTQTLSGKVEFYFTSTSSGKEAAIDNVIITYSAGVQTTYTVTYETNGGSTIPDVTDATALPNPLQTPTKEGYTFAGWFTDAALTIPAEAGAAITQNTTLYAKWVEEEVSYTFSYGEKGQAYTSLPFSRVGTTNEWQIPDFVFPDVNTNQACYVGKNGSWYNDNLGSNNAKSADLYLYDMPLALLQSSGCSNNKVGWDMNSSNAHNAIGTLRIYDNYSDDNLYVGFIPDGYGLMSGVEGSDWSAMAFARTTDDAVWVTQLVMLTADMLNGTYKYYVGLLTSSGGYTYCANSETLQLSTMGTNANGTWGGNLSTYSAGQRGIFRIWTNSCNNSDTKNFVCHFVPYYTLVYNANYPDGVAGAPVDTYANYVSTEENQTLTLSAAPVAPDGYTFKGWTVNRDGTGTLLSAGGEYSLNQPSANTTLYAQWEKEGDVSVSCKTYVWYFSVPDGETNSDRFTFTGNVSGSNTLANTMTIDGKTYTCTKRSSSYSGGFSFTVDNGKEATLHLCILGGGNSRVIHVTQGDVVKTVTINQDKNDDNTYNTFSVKDLTPGTWDVTCCDSKGAIGKSFYLAMLGLHECQSCTSPTAPLQITSSSSIKIGETATVSVNENTGNSGAVTYSVSPATGSVTADGVFSATEAGTYTITASQETNNGVCGGEATCTIEVKDLDLCATPAIATQPFGATWCGTDAVAALSVSASVTDGGTLSYQWLLDGSPVADAISASYTPTQAGKYQCQVTNTKQGYKSVTVVSEEAEIVINMVPTTVKIEIEGGVSELNVGESVTLTASTDGTDVAYQWYKDDAPLSGQTNSTYTYTALEEELNNTVQIRCEVQGCNNAKVSSDVVSISVVYSECNYITKNTTLSATMGYDFGNQVLYIYKGGYETSTNKGTVCFPATYRYYASAVVVQLKNYGVSAIRFQGQQDYDVAVAKVEVASALDGDYTELTGYTSIDYTGTSCGELGIEQTQIQAGKFVRFTFSGGEKNEFRISGLCVEGLQCTMPALSYNLPNVTVDWADVQSITLPELNNPENLTVEYSSSNESVATVDEEGNVTIIGAGTTTVSADFAGDDARKLCSTSASYTLTVTCSDDVPLISPSESTVHCSSVTLRLMASDGTTPVTQGTVTWFKDGAVILDATGYTYEATSAGTYTATLEVNCPQQTSNAAVITDDAASVPSIARLVEKHFFQIEKRDLRPYKSETRYPLFLLTPTGTAADVGQYRVSATVHKNDGTFSRATTPVDWVRTDRADNGALTLGADYTKLAAWITKEGQVSATGTLSVGDTVFVTVAPANACGEIDSNIRDSIPVILTDKYSLGYIVTGPKDGNIMAVTSGNLEDALYEGLKQEYNVVPLNAYSAYDYMNYEPYDILLLTDYPTAKDNKSYVNALADLVDKKPVLSLKAHMSSLDAWKAKGFEADPIVPGDGKKENAPKTLTVLCFTHDIFNGATWDSEEDRTITILDNVYTGDDKAKGIQGFTALTTSNMMNIATVYDSKGDRNLVACCERQEKVEARFVMLSVNQGATKYINAVGIKMIDLLLEYLLKTDKNSVSDCSLTFDNGDADGDGVVERDGAGDHLWRNKANWSSNSVPSNLHNVRIEADCEVDHSIYGVANVRINKNYRLTIKPEAGLISVGKFALYEAGKPTETMPVTNPEYITVQADANNTGMLMHSHAEQLAATVQMYSPAYYSGTLPSGKPKRFWSYVGIPVKEADVPANYRGAYTYLWDETSGWIRKGDGTTVYAFGGIGLSQPQPLVFTFAGDLAEAKDMTLTLTNTASGMSGMNLIGNSWTAPIQITKMKVSDFGEGLDPVIYIYNTGRDPESGPEAVDDFTTPGTWMTIPVNTARQSGWEGPKVIPAMQAFEVNFTADATQTTATLTLDYDTLVRAAVDDLSLYTHKLYKPRANAENNLAESTAEVLRPAAEDAIKDEPLMLRLRLESQNRRADLYLLQDERFSAGYDAGWDGYWQAGDETAIGVYALTAAGNMVVSAQPELEGTTVVTSVGSDKDCLITFSFSGGDGNAPALYLNDMQLRRSVLIDNDTWYSYRAGDNDMKNRFVISATPLNSSIETSVAEVVNSGEEWLISNPAGEPVEVAVYDAAGRLCGIQRVTDCMIPLELPATQGVYMVHLKGKTTQKVLKIVR